jgi:hypothetical protein
MSRKQNRRDFIRKAGALTAGMSLMVPAAVLQPVHQRPVIRRPKKKRREMRVTATGPW